MQHNVKAGAAMSTAARVDLVFISLRNVQLDWKITSGNKGLVREYGPILILCSISR